MISLDHFYILILQEARNQQTPPAPSFCSFEGLTNQIHFTKLLKVVFDVQTFGNSEYLVMFLLKH